MAFQGDLVRLVIELVGGHLREVDQFGFDVLCDRGDEQTIGGLVVRSPEGGQRCAVLVQAKAGPHRGLVLDAMFVEFDAVLHVEQCAQAGGGVGSELQVTQRYVGEVDFTGVAGGGGQHAGGPGTDANQHHRGEDGDRV
ncbi:hypothetical protein R11007_02372 [Ralstonia holmesii]|nr:hypothetical protein R11007_02372 [Ralstonia sp. LMG 32967]